MNTVFTTRGMLEDIEETPEYTFGDNENEEQEERFYIEKMCQMDDDSISSEELPDLSQI